MRHDLHKLRVEPEGLVGRFMLGASEVGEPVQYTMCRPLVLLVALAMVWASWWVAAPAQADHVPVDMTPGSLTLTGDAAVGGTLTADPGICLPAIPTLA